MRIAVLVLGILGGLLGGLLGMNWIAEYNEAQGMVAELEAAGADLSEIESLMRAAYVLLAGVVLGIAGGVMAFKGNGKMAGGLMLATPIIAAVMAPASLMGSFLLIIGGGLAFLVKPAADAAEAAPAAAPAAPEPAPAAPEAAPAAPAAAPAAPEAAPAAPAAAPAAPAAAPAAPEAAPSAPAAPEPDAGGDDGGGAGGDDGPGGASGDDGGGASGDDGDGAGGDDRDGAGGGA